MTDLGPKTTGLPMVVYFSAKMKSEPHGPSIKVSQRYGHRILIGEWFTMTIEDDPRIIGTPGAIRVNDLVLVSEFIRANKDLLVDFWEQKEPVDTPGVPVSTMDVLNNLRKV
jgi:hypothetical protein